MVVVNFRLIIMLVAYNATEYCVVTTVRVTVGTGVPFAFVFSAVNREVHTIMIKRGGSPAFLFMTLGTVC